MERTDTSNDERTVLSMRVSTAFLLGLTASSLAACESIVEPTALGSSVERNEACYRWGTSMLHTSRTDRNPDHVLFAGGDLHLVGTPGTHHLRRNEGRRGLQWGASLPWEVPLDIPCADAVGTADGGVVLVGSNDDEVSVVRVDADGDVTATGALALPSYNTTDKRIVALEDGFVVSGRQSVDDSRRLAVSRLDGDLQTLWTTQVDLSTEFDITWTDLAPELRVTENGAIVVATDHLFPGEVGQRQRGLRRLRFAADGALLADDVTPLGDEDADEIADLEIRTDGGIYALEPRGDVAVVHRFDADLAPQWVATSEPERDSLEQGTLAWDPYTDRVLLVTGQWSGSTIAWYAILDDAGTFEWTVEGGAGSSPFGGGATPDPSGGFVAIDAGPEVRVRQVLPAPCG